MEEIPQIKLPEEFKKILLKTHDEIEDIVAIGFNSADTLDPTTFRVIGERFLVKVVIFCKKGKKSKGDKDLYKSILDDLFNMTYGSDMDFVEFFVDSVFVPSIKTNKEKFVEMFFE